jgi:hypothetical protein
VKFTKTVVLCAVLALFAASSSSAQGQRGRGGRGGGGAASLLQIPEVQKELKLDEAQLDLLKQVGAELQQKGQALFQNSQSLSDEERRKRFTDFRLESDKKIGELLDAKQKERLRQLELQREGLRVLGRADVQEQLKLSADQKSKIQATMDAERTTMQKAFEEFRAGGQNMTDDQRRQAFAKFGEMRTATDQKLGTILTEAQKKQFQTMQGAPFTFPERRGGPGGNRRPRNNN